MGNWCIFIDQKCLAGHCATVPGPIFKILFSGVGYLSRLLCLAFTMSHSMCGDLPVPSKGPAEKVFTYTYKSWCISKIKSLMASIRDSNNSYRLYLSYEWLWAAVQPVVMTLYQFQFCPDLSGHPCTVGDSKRGVWTRRQRSKGSYACKIHLSPKLPSI